MNVDGDGRKAQSLVRTSEEWRRLTEAVIAFVPGYNQVALAAISLDSGRVYVGADEMTAEELDQFLSLGCEIQSNGNPQGEPCYPSLELANQGHNDDGIPHQYYFVIDASKRVVVAFVDRDGMTRLQFIVAP